MPTALRLCLVACRHNSWWHLAAGRAHKAQPERKRFPRLFGRRLGAAQWAAGVGRGTGGCTLGLRSRSIVRLSSWPLCSTLLFSLTQTLALSNNSLTGSISPDWELPDSLQLLELNKNR